MRIATARYVLTGRVQGVADAVRLEIDASFPTATKRRPCGANTWLLLLPQVRLLVEEDVLSCVGAEMLHDINTFRKRYCYLQAVDQVAKLVSSVGSLP